MLTEDDIAWIKANRKEITHNRTDALTLYHKVESTETDPVTGMPKPSEPVPEVIEATFYRLTSQSAGADGIGIVVVGGVVAEPGNAIINFDVEIDCSDVEKVIHNASGEEYVIKARDKIGLGEVNRNYVLLELIV